ncbi:MAG TPA: hypothetical protein VI937_01165 [Negativicutes bacterium]|nr:hypothetical protein [Negativicutes bacterium]
MNPIVWHCTCGCKTMVEQPGDLCERQQKKLAKRAGNRTTSPIKGRKYVNRGKKHLSGADY